MDPDLDSGPHQNDANSLCLWYNFKNLEVGGKRTIFLNLLRNKISENVKKKKLVLSGQQGQEGDGGETQPQYPRQLIYPR
jgi:hypothetical protein